MSKDKIVLARAKAFSRSGVRTYHFLVSPDGTVQVYDHVSMHYTNCHNLSRSAIRRIRNLAKSEETQRRSAK